MKKSLVISLAFICAVALPSLAQESLLNFTHSRVVTENYNNEMSLVDEVIYYNGENIVSEQINCRCERLGDQKLAIEFEHPSTGVNMQPRIIQLKLDLLIVMDAFLSSGSAFAGERQTSSIGKMNVQLSNFDFDKLNQLRGVAHLAMPTNTGFIDTERLVYIRFKCTEGKVTDLTENLQIATASR